MLAVDEPVDAGFQIRQIAAVLAELAAQAADVAADPADVAALVVLPSLDLLEDRGPAVRRADTEHDNSGGDETQALQSDGLGVD